MIQELEALLRAGKVEEARKGLRELRIAKVPRRDACAMASLARRAGMCHLSLRVLSSVVRAEGRRVPKVAATDEEKIEYAAALRTMGSIREASELLEAIDREAHPGTVLQLAFCRIAEWDYAAAIPLLESYLGLAKVTEYDLLVGRLNLLEALIHEQRYMEAEALRDRLERTLDPTRHSLHFQRCLVLSAQLRIFHERRPEKAIAALERAPGGSRGEARFLPSLLVAKWLAIARSRLARRVLPELERVRATALETGSWETVRDCDFHAAELRGDRAALVRLYFGTPYSAYRARILSALGGAAGLPEKFAWQGEFRGEPRRAFDLRRAGDGEGRLELSAGQGPHRLLVMLCRDFYRPLPLLSAFSLLFDGVHFDPGTSPNRVQHVVSRLRSLIAGSGMPIGVLESEGSYRVEFLGPATILIPREPLPLGTRELELCRLRDRLGSPETFTAREALAASGSSKSVLHVLLRWAVSERRLFVTGRTHRARYSWVT